MSLLVDPIGELGRVNDNNNSSGSTREGREGGREAKFIFKYKHNRPIEVNTLANKWVKIAVLYINFRSS